MNEMKREPKCGVSIQHAAGEPGWADVARGFLATGIMVSTMVMVSFFLTGDRAIGYAAIAVGLCFVACIPLVERSIDRASRFHRGRTRFERAGRQV